MTDYWPSEELQIGPGMVLDFCLTGDTTVVSGYGVKSAGTDVSDSIQVIIASKNAGWGVSLRTIATTSKPVPVLVHGVVKMVVGADGSTRNYDQTFGSAGLLGNRTANTVTTFPIGVYALQSGSSADEVAYLW